MPELPEVETIRRELGRLIRGKTISEVCVYNPLVVRQPSVDKFKKGLTGTTIKAVKRKAKVLILELSNGKSLVIHLKMTGQLIFPGKNQASRVSFRFSNGQCLDFNDQRLFGELRCLDDWRSLKFIRELGPEPFDMTADEFRRMLSSKKTKIKPLLMDQTFIAGIGNLYAAESLFRARISPQRSAQSLSDKEKDNLFNAIKHVLTEAIKYGGSSVDDYVRLSGERGNYARYHKVYGRQGRACFVCQTPVKRISLGGRGTYFCAKCQK
jgi:formamidopyrimidine-DNA glycosylase